MILDMPALRKLPAPPVNSAISFREYVAMVRRCLGYKTNLSDEDIEFIRQEMT